MGKNERAVFVITKDADEAGEDDKLSPPRRLEYDISLDGWVEEVDLSERKDRSLTKRVVRDGDGLTQPVDIGMVTVRCVYQTPWGIVAVWCVVVSRILVKHRTRALCGEYFNSRVREGI